MVEKCPCNSNKLSRLEPFGTYLVQQIIIILQEFCNSMCPSKIYILYVHVIMGSQTCKITRCHSTIRKQLTTVSTNSHFRKYAKLWRHYDNNTSAHSTCLTPVSTYIKECHKHIKTRPCLVADDANEHFHDVFDAKIGIYVRFYEWIQLLSECIDNCGLGPSYNPPSLR